MYTLGNGSTWRSVTNPTGRTCLYLYETLSQADFASARLGCIPMLVEDLPSLINDARRNGVTRTVKFSADESVSENVITG